MKKIISYLMLLFVCTSLFAQTNFSKKLFPTLAGLSRTYTIEMYDLASNDGKRNGGYPKLTAPVADTIINGKTYLQFEDEEYLLTLFLREENNKVLVSSTLQEKDLVLYDYTLEVGDSLPALYVDNRYFPENLPIYIVDYNIKADGSCYYPTDTFVVTDVSYITLLDGIERKKWTLKNNMYGLIEYVEGIGCFGDNTNYSGNFFSLIVDIFYDSEMVGNHLVCVSQNGQLLYSMSQEEMNSFAVDCYCLSNSTESAIEHLTNSSISIQKFLYNNQLLIQNEDKTYNVMGVEVGE